MNELFYYCQVDLQVGDYIEDGETGEKILIGDCWVNGYQGEEWITVERNKQYKFIVNLLEPNRNFEIKEFKKLDKNNHSLKYIAWNDSYEISDLLYKDIEGKMVLLEYCYGIKFLEDNKFHIIVYIPYPERIGEYEDEEFKTIETDEIWYLPK